MELYWNTPWQGDQISQQLSNGDSVLLNSIQGQKRLESSTNNGCFLENLNPDESSWFN